MYLLNCREMQIILCLRREDTAADEKDDAMAGKAYAPEKHHGQNHAGCLWIALIPLSLRATIKKPGRRFFLTMENMPKQLFLFAVEELRERQEKPDQMTVPFIILRRIQSTRRDISTHNAPGRRKGSANLPAKSRRYESL